MVWPAVHSILCIHCSKGGVNADESQKTLNEKLPTSTTAVLHFIRI